MWRDNWHGPDAPVERDPARAAREVFRPRAAALAAALPPRADGRPRSMGPGLSTDDAKCPIRQNKANTTQWVKKIDYLPELGVVFLHVPKCGSSSLRRLLIHTFGGHVMIPLDAVPPGAFTVAVLRDPVERFLSGYEEGIIRALRYGNQSRDFKDLQRRVPFIRERLAPYNTSDAFWRNTALAANTFDEYITTKYDPRTPIDIHLALMSSLVAAQSDRVDFVGYVDTIDDDWVTILRILGIENMHGDKARPLAPGDGMTASDSEEGDDLRRASCADPTGLKCVTYKRYDPHLAAENLTDTQRARVCELVRQDIECLALPSKWC